MNIEKYHKPLLDKVHSQSNHIHRNQDRVFWQCYTHDILLQIYENHLGQRLKLLREGRNHSVLGQWKNSCDRKQTYHSYYRRHYHQHRYWNYYESDTIDCLIYYLPSLPPPPKLTMYIAAIATVNSKIVFLSFVCAWTVVVLIMVSSTIIVSVIL